MRNITITDRQNIVDIAIQYYGSAASVIDLCIDNNLELDSNLAAGQTLLIQDTYPDSANGDIADYLQGNTIVVVSMNEPLLPNDFDYLLDNNSDFIVTNDGSYIAVDDGTDGTDLTDNDGNYITTNDGDYIDVQM